MSTNEKKQQLSQRLVGAPAGPDQGSMPAGCDGDRPRMRVFTDDTDTVIAASIEDALVILEDYGLSDRDPEAWGPVADDEQITIACDASGHPCQPDDDGARPLTKTAAEWVQRGRGFLCTTEF